MLNLICRAVEKIVFSGMDGTILILPLLILVWVLYGQVKDCIRLIERILREEGVEKAN